MGHHPCDDPNRLPLGGCSSWRGCCPRPFGDSSEDAAAVPARRLPPPPGWERQEEVGRGQPGARGQRGRREAELPGTGRRCCCRWSRSNCTATSPRSFPFISPLLAPRQLLKAAGRWGIHGNWGRETAPETAPVEPRRPCPGSPSPGALWTRRGQPPESRRFPGSVKSLLI